MANARKNLKKLNRRIRGIIHKLRSDSGELNDMDKACLSHDWLYFDLCGDTVKEECRFACIAKREGRCTTMPPMVPLPWRSVHEK